MNVEALTSMRPLAVAEPTQRSSARPEPGSAEAAAADRKKVSQQFEAILVRQLLGNRGWRHRVARRRDRLKLAQNRHGYRSSRYLAVQAMR
jgi:hypothetical protein